jgi:hypothetical protein
MRFGIIPISRDVGTSHKVMHGLAASGAPYFLKQSRELTIKWRIYECNYNIILNIDFQNKMKDTIYHFIADLPAYAVVAWVNLAQVIPTDMNSVETFLLHYGWILLLSVRLLNAFIDLYKRAKQHDFTIEEKGEIKKVKSIVWELKNFIK